MISHHLLLSIFLHLFSVLEGARPGRNLLVSIKGQGTVVGKDVGISRTQRATAFLGIPFAEPPLGNLRFAPPQTKPWPSWTGIKNATEFMPSCMQIHQNFDLNDKLNLANRLYPGKSLEYNEDCLYLNVFVPEGKTPRGLGWPVAIWFHPGDFNVGSPILWDATALAIKQKIIIVTTSYRLNILGFLTTMDDNAPGNYGLLDQLAAMEWVQDHIQFFNGSNTDVVIWGHSAGAVSVSLHLVSELSTGTFHRAITMSGNFLSPKAIKKPDRELLNDIADAFYCKKDSNELLMECLRKAKLDVLLKEGSSGDWGPVVDGSFKNVTKPFLKDDPKVLLVNGQVNKVPLMAGYTDMEDVYSINSDVSKPLFYDSIREYVLEDAPPLLDNETCRLNEDLLVESVLFHYTPTTIPEEPTIYRKRFIDFTTDKNYGAITYHLGLQMSKYAQTFLYRFDHKMKTSGIADNREWIGVPHQFDLPIIWGMPYWTTLSPQVVWNSLDKKTSEVAMSLFGNFTKYSIPVQSKKTIAWDPFTSDNPRVFLIDKNFTMSDSSNYDYKSLIFWNDYYPKIVIAANICCNSTDAGTSLQSLEPVVVTSLLIHFGFHTLTKKGIFLFIYFTYHFAKIHF